MSGSLTETSSLAGASGQGGAYQIEQSMYIGDGANSSPKLQRICGTPEGTAAFTASTWMKRGTPNTGSKTIFSWIVRTTSSTLPYAYLEVLNDFPSEAAALHWAGYGGAGSYAWNNYYDGHPSYGGLEEASFRDYAAWMHVHLKISGTSAEIYINGVLFHTGGFASGYYPISGSKLQVACNDSNQLGSCYLADTYYIDGQALAPTEFGEVNEDTGEWVPIEYSGTYAGNSVYLNYSDSADFGTDSSGLGNDFTATSISASQQTLDTPTNTFCNLNPLVKPSGTNTFTQGNLKVASSSAWNTILGTIPMSSGKWYWEAVPGSTNFKTGVMPDNVPAWNMTNPHTAYGILYLADGTKQIDGTATSYGATWAGGDIIGYAVDMDASTITFYKNNASQGSISFSGTVANAASAIPGGVSLSDTSYWNFGQDSSFVGTKTAQGNGGPAEDFYYTPPTGYVALNTSNMPDPTIENPRDHFNTVLYTGTGSSATNAITGVGFAPDLIWLKDRSATTHHGLFDTIRGTGQRLVTHSTGAEDTQASMLSAFGADGFTTSDHHNTVNNLHVSWNWKAGGAAASNTDGTITSSVSANPTAGFSVVGWTGTGSNATVGHGLSQAPELVINKSRSQGNVYAGWTVYSKPTWVSTTDTNLLYLNTTAAEADDTNIWQDAPTASLIRPQGGGWAGIGVNGENYIAYCFHSVEGYSKIGAFTGGGNNGAFVYTGFKPAYVLFKSYSNAGNEWFIFDNKMNPRNTQEQMFYLQAQSNAGQVTTGDHSWPSYTPLDFLSNGIKFHGTQFNPSGYGMLYMAFAESPFKYSNAR